MSFKSIYFFAFLNCVMGTHLTFAADLMEKVINTELKGDFAQQLEIYKKLFAKAFEKENEEKAVVYFMKIFATYVEADDADSPDILKALNCSAQFMAQFANRNPKFLKKIESKCKNFNVQLPEMLSKLSDDQKKSNKPKKKKKNKVYAVDAFGRTELHNLVRAGNLKGVQTVLTSNCSAEYFNMRTKEGIHVLHYAAGRVNCDNGFEIAKLLINYVISKNYDLNVQTIKKGRTPLDVAKDHGHEELIALLSSKGAR